MRIKAVLAAMLFCGSLEWGSAVMAQTHSEKVIERRPAERVWTDKEAGAVLGYKLVKPSEQATTFPLPLENLMDFDSIIDFNGGYMGRDIFVWRLFGIENRCGFGPFVSDEYPITPIGERVDVMAVGLAFSWNFP